jgi:hypothetical protein
VSLPAPDATETSLYAICEHIKPSGERCGSPAWHDEKYCYHHAEVRKCAPKTNLFVRLFNPHPEQHPDYRYEMPYLEDPAAIQIGFMQLIHGVAQELIRPDRAKLILSALHGAALNLRMMEKAEARRERTSVPRKQPDSVKVGEVKEGESA